MKYYGIGDLHLSLSKDKPMDIFGENWLNHAKQIEQNWQKLVKDEDVVLIVGDTSWAIDLNEAKADLDFLNNMSGKKILIMGNHDYWWTSTSKVSSMYPNMIFLKNDSVVFGELGICGSRGWLCPNDTRFTTHDMKIYNREQIRLRLSLDSAIRKGAKEIILMMHYPPTNDKKQRSAFLDIIEEYPVKTVLYGHLHGKASFGFGISGMHNNVEYHLLSSDYLGFIPKKI